jgi:mono/diheme cytochrome c family protein
MKIWFTILSGTLLLACSLAVLAQPQGQPTAAKTPASAVHKKSKTNDGEQRFQANCGRCHTPPEAISPREVKAVLQHMRVRAMLSAEDEQLILKYLAP